MCNIIFPLEIREHILRFTGKNFTTVVKGILGGTDIYYNYYSILERLVCKRIKKNSVGNSVCKLMLPGDIFHSSVQPSYVIKNEKGIILKETWHHFERLHRKEPSIKSYYDDGTLKELTWCWENKMHRDNNLPAHIKYNIEGTILSETWYINGNMKRTDNGIIDRQYYKNGLLRFEQFQLNLYNETHFIKYNENGNKNLELWDKDTHLHRDNNLPAYKKYFPDGELKYDIWYTAGRRIRSVEY